MPQLDGRRNYRTSENECGFIINPQNSTYHQLVEILGYGKIQFLIEFVKMASFLDLDLM